MQNIVQELFFIYFFQIHFIASPLSFPKLIN